MELQAWMKQERYTDHQFIDAVNAILLERKEKLYTWRAVLPWRTGGSIPRPPVVSAIAELTKGAVKYEDHAAKNAPNRKRPTARVSAA